MSGSDAEVKKAAELKLWLESRITELQEEIERLREALSYVDTTLRAETFRSASELVSEAGEIAERRELTKDKGGQPIATASITSAKLVIEPAPSVTLRADVPPFKSFLLGKILQGMKAKDEDLVAKGKLADGEQLRFNFEERNGSVSRVVVENYREKSRLNEILNTVSWTFSRMLEK
ncbi:MAG: hypothetical protein E6K95_03395 [Thaumarchaeota archaeon]|nr:MAG: hypothetical protein E6K95_03395 [Nitrososphaerota archaeon]